MKIEQRSCVRMSVAKNAYAALKFGTYKVGKIQNISMDGLMFLYIGSKAPVDASADVDLFIPHNCLYLPNLPCKVVYSFVREQKDNGLFFAPLRCGMRFRSLDKKKRKNLWSFIDKITKR